jgi:hypothetical protein
MRRPLHPPKHHRTAALLALATTLATLSAAAAAHASATMTSPANGATVSLDANANFSFAWTLPAGEVGPTVWEGDSPTYDPDTLSPFSGICGSPAADQPAYSCRPDSPLNAGTHYAFIFTTNSDNTQHYFSPVTSFVVPVRIGWGCGPKARDTCGDPKGVTTQYVPHPPIGFPYSTLDVDGWLNERENTPVKFKFTLKRGRKVLARIQDVQRTSEFVASSGLELTHSRISWGSGRHMHWHAPRGGTKLTCTFVMSGGGLTLTRTATLKAPAARG